MSKEIQLPSIDPTPIMPKEPPFPTNIGAVCNQDKQPKDYKDIVYIVGSNYFYLLTEDACHFLDSAEQKFRKVIENKSKDNIMLALAQAGIIDGLLSIEPQSFLEAADKEQFNELKDKINNLQESVYSNGNYSTRDWQAEESRSLVSEYEKLLQKGRQNAVKQGYQWDKGKLYSPREAKIKQHIEQYQKARDSYAKERELTPQDQVDLLEKSIANLKEVISSSQYDVKKAAEYALAERERSLAIKKPNLKKLQESIEFLALAGIATPEFALAQVSGGEGYTLLAQYYKYLKDAKTFENDLKDRLKSLHNSTNKYAIPPKSILKNEYQQLRELRRKAKELHIEAQVAVAKMENSSILLWNKSDYLVKPADRIYTAEFPLREYLRAEPNPNQREGQFDQLRYFSLSYLECPENLAKNDKHKANWSATKKSDAAFYQVMRNYVDPLPIQDIWFDQKGLFNYDAFKATLVNENIYVESLDKPDGWRETLEQILYSDELKKRIDPFDNTAQGQFFRFVTLDANYSVDQKRELEFKVGEDIVSGERSSGAQAQWKCEAKSEAVLARGEINLIHAVLGRKFIYYPPSADIDPNRTVLVEYGPPGKPKKQAQFCMGALQNRIALKAYGFAGANLCLGTGVVYSGDGLYFPGIFRTESHRKASQSNGLISTQLVELKAEAQLGIQLTCYIDWLLPSGEYAVPDYLLEEATQRLTLTKMSVKAEIGVELDVPFYFRVVDNKLRVGMVVGTGYSKFVIEGNINPNALSAWVWQFQRLLRRCEYHRVTIADEQAFKTMSALGRAMLYTQMEVGLILAQGKDALDKVLNILDTDRAGICAHTLYTGDERFLQDWIRLMPPEGLGPLIGTLLEEPDNIEITLDGENFTRFNEDQVLAMQQIALAKIFRWLATDSEREVVERLVEEALSRTRKHSYSIYKEWRLLEFKRVSDKIKEFILRNPGLITGKLAIERDKVIYDAQRNIDLVSEKLYGKVIREEVIYKSKMKTIEIDNMPTQGVYK